MLDPARIYGWLLKLYPVRFREEYQAPMERLFRDEHRDTYSRGDRVRLWLHTIQDLAISVPVEIFRELTQDLKHTLRVYRGRTFSAALAVVALGLAIGASTGIFSVLNALLVRSLPFRNPEQLVELWHPPVEPGKGRAAFTGWHDQSSYLEDAAAFSASEMNLTGGRDALRVKVAETSANFFRLLGTKALVGRTFTSAEDTPGKGNVAVISYSIWQQLYGGDPRVTGATLHLNGAPFTIVGVALPRFDYPGKTSIWTPSVFEFERVPKHGAFFFQTIARLKSSVAIGTAREMFEAEVGRSEPGSRKVHGQNRPSMVSLRDQLAGPVRQASWVLGGMIFFVLLTACANVAQLLLSRTSERRQELAVRAALGASRGRLIRQLITEATVLTTTGAVVGLLIAHWVSRAMSSVTPAQLAEQQYTILDWRVLGFAAAMAIVTGIVFGVLPAWLVGCLQPSGHMIRAQPGARDIGTRRGRSLLVMLQAALTLTLVASSVTMGRTFLKLLDADLGFRSSRVVTLNVSLQGTKHRKSSDVWHYYSEALDRLRSVDGVEAAGSVSYLPLANNVYMASAFKLDSGRTVTQTVINAATPGYFRAMSTPILAGRDFGPAEKNQSESAVIVNEAFARSAGMGTEILGRRITTSWRSTPYLVVGVVGTTSFAGPGFPGGPQIYWPIEEEPPPTITFVAKVHGQAGEYLARCRDAIRSVDRQVPVYEVTTLDARLAEVLGRPKFFTTATLFFAVLALLLAAVGIYGTATYSVAQRMHEMGVRLALGASYERIRTMMLRENLVPVTFGILAGIAGAVASGRYLQHLIVNAESLELRTCAFAAGLLIFTGITASWGATARVLAIDPVDAVRSE